MISCKRATELISKQMEEKLTLKEDLSLKLHLFICEFCEKFSQQIKMIREALTKGEVHTEEEKIPVPNGAKERVKEKLNQTPD